MNNLLRCLGGLLVFILISRLLAMDFLPLLETTEPRYAEIARIMAETGDWITPWFNYNEPFWGKPPLSFWCQALAFRLMGVNEFAVRLPSLIATFGILWLIFHMANRLVDRSVAWLAVVIYSTTACGYLLAGAALTDPFLTFGSTLALVSAVETTISRQRNSKWRYGLFVGIAIGLLAKGPLAAVLVLVPLFFWLTLNFREHFNRFPWVTGSIMLLLLVLPWYIAAELKTPGFLNYFIVGEHFKRFVNPGWSGDQYGNAHQYAYGTIWWFAVWATFPWGIIVAGLLLSKPRENWLGIRNLQLSGFPGLLLLWTLWPLVFFSMAGNILWTYVQPALPSFATLLAMALSRKELGWSKISTLAAAVLPIAGLSVTLISFVDGFQKQLKTEKTLVEYAEQHHLAGAGAGALYYLGKPPFSARFYSNGAVRQVSEEELTGLLNKKMPNPIYLAVPKHQAADIDSRIGDSLRPLLNNRSYTLFEVQPASLAIDLRRQKKQPREKPGD